MKVKFDGKLPEKWTGEMLRKVADFYFAKCDSEMKQVVLKDDTVWVPAPRKYTVAGFCACARLSRSTFLRWAARGEADDLSREAEQIRLEIEANWEERTEGAAFAWNVLKTINPEVYNDKLNIEHSVSSGVKEMVAEWGKQWKTPVQQN